MPDRRAFLRSTSAAGVGLWSAGLAAPGAGAQAGVRADDRQVYELRTYELRTDLNPARTHEFFRSHLVPALGRAGAAAVGVFRPEIGLPTTALVVLVAHASAAELMTVADRLAADATLRAGVGAWERGGAPYVRYETALYRAFPGHPQLDAGPSAAGRAPRLFELRTYEAPHLTGLASKIEMFDREEIRIFRDVGFANVFYGEAIAGARLPHLTYLVAFENMEARNRAWGAFGSHPDWQRIRVRPGWTDAETVSSIRQVFLRPTDYSGIR